MSGRVTVAMLTYRRPGDLQESLDAIVDQLDAGAAHGGARLLVVDNDPDGSAEPVVRARVDDRVDYVHEPRPGIAAARNRAVEESVDDTVLVFIDDDERPGPGWLDHLLRTHDRHGALGVVGPVVSVFDGPLDPWIEAGGFFRRRRLSTGTPVTVVATNNLLLDVPLLRATGVRFDEAYGLSGGSDTLFSLQVAARGHHFVWCAEAGVTDVVPASRATRGWVRRRALRSGNSWSRANVEVSPAGLPRLVVRSRLLAAGGARVLGGVLRWALGVVTADRAARANGHRNVARGAGMVSGALGHVYHEYRRRPSASG